MSKRAKRIGAPGLGPRKAVIGYEAEFNLYVAGQKRRPEAVFRNPQAIVREAMIPRTGRSFHMPSGGAVYFDTGVIEVATPIIELEEGCCVRAGRSLWEQIGFLRQEFNAWEQRHGTEVRLEGFSEHFNMSVPMEHGLTEAGAAAGGAAVDLYAAGAGDAAGGEPREHRRGRAAAREPGRGDGRFHAGPGPDDGGGGPGDRHGAGGAGLGEARPG